MRREGFLPGLFRLLGEGAPQVPPSGLAGLTGLFARRVKRSWLPLNQKLDVCVSSSDPGAFRFSVSDFGERGALGPVIMRYAASFGGRYDLAALGRFLRAGASLGRSHQTTLGLDWGTGKDAPRLKVYHEELYPVHGGAAKERLLSAACGPSAAPAGAELAALSAVCLDLTPDGGGDFKFYFRREAPGGLRVPPWQKRAMAGLKLEKKCFYYEMRAAGSGRKKAYKVYETGGIGDLTPAMREICGLYASGGHPAALERILGLVAYARRSGMTMAPVLFAAGDGAGGAGRTLDAYFCFKRAAARRKRGRAP
ncbi:MAG: hypothetical protein M0025_02035 [Elusimicrobia bacterium]|nr:hypothetical protein [Elusimicrobiota bacterium]MDA8242881.1 hypothetical protein [Elusimicrobiota bacterium]